MRVRRSVLVAAVLGLVCFFAGGGPASAGVHASGGQAHEEAVVYPTGDPAVDVARVQSAVDTYGRVLLRATDVSGVPTPFDFGENTPVGGFVVFGNDVSVRGEIIGSARTTIEGGFAPFRSYAADPVRSSIRGIEFDSPGAAALFVDGAAGVAFVRNVVRDVVGLPEWLPGISKGQGVWIVGPETVTGDVLIADNVIDGVDAQNGYGLALFGFTADARIERNRISGVDTAGILVGQHTGRVSITANAIEPGPAKYETDYGHGTGIIVGNALGGSAHLRGNTIECVNPWAAGILIAASRTLGDAQELAVVSRNRVIMQDSTTAVALVGSVSNTLVNRNRLEGTAAFAFEAGVWFTPEDIVESNRFRLNSISKFDSAIADVFFDVNTRENTFVGRVNSVIDLGIDNWINGATPSEASALRGQRLNERQGLTLHEEARVPDSLASPR